MSRTILILETPRGDLRELADCFRSASEGNWTVERVLGEDELIGRLNSGGQCDLLVLDHVLGDGARSGAEILPSVKSIRPYLPVIAVAQRGTVEAAASAIKAGAADFLVRGRDLNERVSTLLGKVRQTMKLIEQNRLLSEQNRLLREAERARYRIVGESPQIKSLIARIRRVAAIPRPVLIVGERGTGKELVARAIHAASGAADRPMVVANCAALPDALLESELFGHERGAFTGADALRRGKFELADEGTLFLDEIGHMSVPFQQKILRVVEYHAFTRVGGAEEIRTNARIIAATNANLETLMERGEFLRDLYDRLSFETIHVAPLRERSGDVELLARHFLQQFMQEIPAFGGKTFSQEAIKILKAYDFPGNVRELKNIIERAAYRDTTNEINPEDIGMLPRNGHMPSPTGGGFVELVEQFQKRLIEDAVKKSNGNQAAAARTLGLSYHQFRYYYGKFKDA